MEHKEGKRYLIGVLTKFEGTFSHYEMENGVRMAVFIQDGVTDKGNTPTRRVPVHNIYVSELTKNGE